MARVVWDAFCCGAREKPVTFKTRKEARAWLDKYACYPDPGRIERRLSSPPATKTKEKP